MTMAAGGPIGAAGMAVTSHSQHVSLLLDIAIDIAYRNISYDISKRQEAPLNRADSSHRKQGTASLVQLPRSEELC
jgi:hypothetical protein